MTEFEQQYLKHGCECEVHSQPLYFSYDSRAMNTQLIAFNDVISIAELISTAERSQLEEILVELAVQDEKIESRIRARLAGISEMPDLSDLKKEIGSIFYAYSDRRNFINYYNARDFESDLITYSENKTSQLFDDEELCRSWDQCGVAIDLPDCYNQPEKH